MDRDGLSRKRTRKGRDGESEESYNESTNDASTPALAIEHRLFDFTLPKEWEAEFASAIFELGLTYSSPKVIIPLMPTVAGLNTEHIKSHLQKYRIHKPRSKEEFLAFYERYLKDSFATWEKKRGWEHSSDRQPSASSTSPRFANTSALSGSSLPLEMSSSFSSNALSGENSNSTQGSGDDHERLHKKLRKLYDLEQLLIRSNSLLQDWRAHATDVLERSSDLRQEVTTATAMLDQNPVIVHAVSLTDTSNMSINISDRPNPDLQLSSREDPQLFKDHSGVNYGFTGSGDM